MFTARTVHLPGGYPTQILVESSLQGFATNTLLSIVVPMRRQVWLAQSPLSKTSRRTLKGLPVVPGELFDSAALEALERTAQATRTRRQLVELYNRRHTGTGPAAAPSWQYSMPSASFMEPQQLARRMTQRGRTQAQSFHTPRAVEHDRRPPKAI